MKKVSKIWVAALLCLLLTILGALPAAAVTSNIKERKHQPPDMGTISRVFAIDQANQTYHSLPSHEWSRIRNALSIAVTPAQSENKSAKYVGGFCFEMSNGTRRIYTISTAQVLVGDTPLYATVAERKALETLSKNLTTAYPASPAMLAYMEPLKISRLTATGCGFTGKNVDEKKTYMLDLTAAANQNSILTIARQLKNLEVTSRATKIENGHTFPLAYEAPTDMRLVFNTGTTIQLSISDGSIWMYSSDGTRTYEYPIANYDPRSGAQTGDRPLRECLWDIYSSGGNYSAAAIFLTKPETDERVQGAFYSVEDGGENSMGNLGRILDQVRTATPAGKIYPSTRNYLEVYAQGVNGLEHFEFDFDSLTAYYVEAGRGRSVPITNEDYRTVKSLLTGKERSNRTILAENGTENAGHIYTCTARDPIFGQLFDAKEKDDAYQPYTTGKAPSYTKNASFTCWADTGALSSTTVYQNGVMVQNSQKKPWTPAKYNARTLYREISALQS